jgi:hypothetical protein
MAKIERQFHATGDELLNVLGDWCRRGDFYLGAESFFPTWRAFEVSLPLPLGMHQVSRVIIRRIGIDLSATSSQQFLGMNPDSLIILGLREAAISGSTEDKDLFAVWQAWVKGLDAEFHRGATVVAGLTGSTRRLPRHMHSRGAHDLAEQGVPMLAAAGSNTYRFDDVPEPTRTTS